MATADVLKKLGSLSSQAINFAAPAAKEKALQLLGKATGGSVDLTKPAAIAGFAGQSQGKLEMVVKSAVRAGIHPSSIFSHDVISRMQDASIETFRVKMEQEFSTLYSKIDSTALVQINLEEHAKLAMLSDATESIRSFFGGSNMSNRAMRELHVCLKVFLEMNENSLTAVLGKGK